MPDTPRCNQSQTLSRRLTPLQLAVVILAALLQHGCLVLGWGTAVLFDLTRQGDVEFGALENTWRVSSVQWRQHRPVKGIAVSMTDPQLVEPFTKALQGMTDLHVVALDRPAGEPDLFERLAVDAVLTGQPDGSTSQRPPEGAASLQRLVLRLLSTEGMLLWRGELPMLITGSKEPDERQLAHALESHLTQEADHVGLGDLMKVKLRGDLLSPTIGEGHAS